MKCTAFLPAAGNTHWSLSVTNLSKAPPFDLNHHQPCAHGGVRELGGSMHLFISSMDEQLYLEEITPHRHDCRDPPHAAGVGFHDDKFPPRRLAGVARSDPWRSTPAQVGFSGDAMRRRRLPWVVESDHRNNS